MHVDENRHNFRCHHRHSRLLLCSQLNDVRLHQHQQKMFESYSKEVLQNKIYLLIRRKIVLTHGYCDTNKPNRIFVTVHFFLCFEDRFGLDLKQDQVFVNLIDFLFFSLFSEEENLARRFLPIQSEKKRRLIDSESP